MQDEPLIEGEPLVGDGVGGDKIIVGNISDSYTAIGAGAQVIVNQIQKALSAVDELDKSVQYAERRLAEAIQKKLADITKPTAYFVEDRGNPYKALLDYKLEDAPFFYGRSQAIVAMHEKLGNSKLTILHSDSGSGKSSLLQAGLAPRLLVDGHFPLYLRPYDQRPDQFIKKAFLPDYATQPELARFNDEAITLKGFLERVTFYLGDRRLIILLDQFEEFFTELTPEKQQAFATQLRECVESDLPVWWVLALRKEYFSDLRIFSALKPFENEYFLPMFRLDEAQEVIVEPAALKDVAYEAGLVDQILDDIRQNSAEVPPAQMQLVCYTLFDELPNNGVGSVITADLYNKPRGRAPGAPGAQGILTSHLSRVLDRELKGQERNVASLVLEELVSSDVRRVMRSQEELLEAIDPEQAVLLAPVLKALYDNRLVRRELDEHDEPVYELAHDYLLNEIELDPETQARKAAQELLNNEAHSYVQHGTLLSEDKFAIINNQRDNLQIDDTAAELLKKSETVLEAERRHELEQAQKLADEQRLRAEEGEQAASSLRKRLVLASIAAALALVALVAALWFGAEANNQRDFAGSEATKAFVAQGRAEVEAQNAGTAQAKAEANEAEAFLQSTRAAEEAAEADKQRNAALALSTAEAVQRATAVAADDRANWEAERALARQLTVQDDRVEGEDYGQLQRSILLSVEAMRRFNILGERSLSADLALRDSLSFVPQIAGTFFCGGLSSRPLELATFSPDGEELTGSCDVDGTTMWDVSSTEKMAGVSVSRGTLSNVIKLSSDGRYVVKTYDSGSLRHGYAYVWDVTAGDEVDPTRIDYREYGIARGIALNLDGEYLGLAFDDGTRVWDTASGQEIAIIDAEANSPGYAMLAFSPDGNSLAIAGSDALWGITGDGTDITLTRREGLDLGCPGENNHLENVAFSSNGKFLLINCPFTSPGRANIELWDLEDEILKNSFSMKEIRDLAVSTDGQYIAVVVRDVENRSSDLVVQVVEVESGQTIRFENLGSPPAIAFRPDTHELLISMVLLELTGYDDAFGFEQDGLITAVIGQDEEQLILVTADEFDAGTPLFERDFFTGDEWRTVPRAQTSLHLATTTLNDISETMGTLPEIVVETLAFSANGDVIAAANNDGIVRVSPLTNPQEAVNFESDGFLEAISLSPDGRYLGLAGGGIAKVFNVSTGEQLVTLPYNGLARGIAPGSDKSYLVTLQLANEGQGTRGASDLWIPRVLDMSSGKDVWRFESRGLEGSAPPQLTISPNGNYLAYGPAAAEQLSIADLTDAREIAFADHEGSRINAYAFSRDEQHLATAGSDGTVRLWDIAGNQEIARIGYEGPTDSIQISPNGKYVTIVSGDTIRSWNLLPEDLIARACAVLSRNLTWEEWNQYIREEPYRATCDNIPLSPREVEAAAAAYANNGERELAASRFREAAESAVRLEDFHLSLHTCWDGILYDFAAIVLGACEQAKPNSFGGRIGYAVALALNGEIDGAVAEFQSYIEYRIELHGIRFNPTRYESWIDQLEDRQNPFDQDTIQSLFFEFRDE